MNNVKETFLFIVLDGYSYFLAVLPKEYIFSHLKPSQHFLQVHKQSGWRKGFKKGWEMG